MDGFNSSKTNVEASAVPSTEVVRRPTPPRVGSLPACLVQVYPPDDHIGLRREIDSDTLLIGRGADCQIDVGDDGVSRFHARVVRQGADYFLHDLRSKNGTFLNDEPIFLRKLTDGDFIRVGQRIFRFLGGDNIEALYHAEISSLVVTDALTGVPNRRAIVDFLEREISRVNRYRRPLSLLMIDVDHFKQINDRWGHLAGDDVLRLLCARLVPTIRQEEMFGRYGGEEFIRIMPETRVEDAYEVAERMRLLVAGAPLDVRKQSIALTISIGVARYRDGETSAELIREADTQLYEAKKAGRNRTIMETARGE